MIAVEAIAKRYGTVRSSSGTCRSRSPGEVYGLLGANGSASRRPSACWRRSSLPPPAATVAGHDVVRRRAGAAAIGMTLQEAASTRRHAARLLVLHVGRSAAAERARAAGRVRPADRRADQRVKELSGGNRRRLTRVALVGRPGVVFLDEPTTGLDPISRAALWAEVRRLRDEGTTVLLTTQYLDEADRLADRVGILADGRAARGGPAVRFKLKPGVAGRATGSRDPAEGPRGGTRSRRPRRG